jgi:predicted phage baseplate assembly protein
MTLPTPKLDDRSFQDIVNEARRLIPRYCPEWTDHNLSDPGITMIELFAWMMEMLLFRLNRVPDKNFITFLDLIGVKLLPPAAARVDLTFTLTAPQSEPVVIAAGTEVATVRTGTDEAIAFSTDRNLRIIPPTAVYFLSSPDDSAFDDHSDSLVRQSPLVSIFAEEPEPGNAFYLGFQEDLSGHTLVVSLSCSIEGIGVDPDRPPLAWECWDSQSEAWVRMDVERDETGGLNRRGEVTLHLPYVFSAGEVGGKRAYWLRCQLIEPEPEQPTYTASPKVRVLSTYTIGGTVPATHATVVQNEELGRSSGKPSQAFRVAQPPMLPLGRGEIVEVEVPEGWEKWEPVSDFSGSGAEDPHFVNDPIAGEIVFGPSIRQPDGLTRPFGAVPPKGARVRLTRYRTGGGTVGNVGPGTLSVLKSSIPYVSGVSNREAAFGGRDAETLDHAKMRGPRQLRTRNRAVTAEDFEIIALEASSSVARAKCVQPRPDRKDPPPGTVRLFLVPALNGIQRPTPRQLAVPKTLSQTVRSYLDERRLLCTALEIATPPYVWVSVQVQIKVRERLEANTVRQRAEDALYEFLHPLHGGTDGNGWPFGRDLYVADVYAIVHGVPGVEFISEAKIFPIELRTGKIGEPVEHTSVPEGGLVASYRHLVVVQG